MATSQKDKRMSYGNYRAARQGERMMISLMDIPFEHRLVILVSLAQDAIDAAAAHLGGCLYGKRWTITQDHILAIV